MDNATRTLRPGWYIQFHVWSLAIVVVCAAGLFFETAFRVEPTTPPANELEAQVDETVRWVFAGLAGLVALGAITLAFRFSTRRLELTDREIRVFRGAGGRPRVTSLENITAWREKQRMGYADGYELLDSSGDPVFVIHASWAPSTTLCAWLTERFPLVERDGTKTPAGDPPVQVPITVARPPEQPELQLTTAATLTIGRIVSGGFMIAACAIVVPPALQSQAFSVVSLKALLIVLAAWFSVSVLVAYILLPMKRQLVVTNDALYRYEPVHGYWERLPLANVASFGKKATGKQGSYTVVFADASGNKLFELRPVYKSFGDLYEWLNQRLDTTTTAGAD